MPARRAHLLETCLHRAAFGTRDQRPGGCGMKAGELPGDATYCRPPILLHRGNRFSLFGGRRTFARARPGRVFGYWRGDPVRGAGRIDRLTRGAPVNFEFIFKIRIRRARSIAMGRGPWPHWGGGRNGKNAKDPGGLGAPPVVACRPPGSRRAPEAGLPGLVGRASVALPPRVFVGGGGRVPGVPKPSFLEKNPVRLEFPEIRPSLLSEPRAKSCFCFFFVFCCFFFWFFFYKKQKKAGGGPLAPAD